MEPTKRLFNVYQVILTIRLQAIPDQTDDDIFLPITVLNHFVCKKYINLIDQMQE